MKFDKKQLPQLIVLGVLVIICIGYLSFSVFKPKQSGPPPAPAETQATTGSPEQAASDAPAVPSEETRENTVRSGVFPDVSASVGRRDPFTPQMKPARPETATTPRSSPGRATIRQIAQIEGGPLPANPFSRGGISPTGTAIVPVVEKDPEFVLTGVIRGDENVAIIRVGEGGRHVVRQGQLIDGRYKVLRVSDDGAVLAYKNRRIHLRLGGAKNAS